MKQIRKIKQMPFAKPPVISSRLAASLQLKRIRNYLESLNSHSKQLKSGVLQLLKDPKVQQRIEQGNIREWIKDAEDTIKKLRFCTSLIALGLKRSQEIDDLKLSCLGCRMLDTDPGDLAISFCEVWNCSNFSKAIKANHYIFEIFKNIEFEMHIIVSLIAKYFSELCEKVPFEDAKEFADYFFNSTHENNYWKALPKSVKINITENYSILAIYESLDNAKDYLDLIFQMLENGFDFSENAELCNDSPHASIDTLLRYLVITYIKSCLKEKIGDLERVQEFFGNLANLSPNQVLKSAREIFEGLTKDQVLTLCAKLSEKNPNLVHELGEKLFEKEEAA